VLACQANGLCHGLFEIWVWHIETVRVDFWKHPRTTDSALCFLLSARREHNRHQPSEYKFPGAQLAPTLVLFIGKLLTGIDACGLVTKQDQIPEIAPDLSFCRQWAFPGVPFWCSRDDGLNPRPKFYGIQANLDRIDRIRSVFGDGF